MTLDTYADLFDDDLDFVASALSRARLEDIFIVEESAPADQTAIEAADEDEPLPE